MEAEKDVHIEDHPESGDTAQDAPEPVEEAVSEHAETPSAEEPEPDTPAESQAAPETPAESAAESTEQPAPAYDDSSPKKWYIIHTYSGFEQKVKESLRTRADA